MLVSPISFSSMNATRNRNFRNSDSKAIAFNNNLKSDAISFSGLKPQQLAGKAADFAANHWVGPKSPFAGIFRKIPSDGIIAGLKKNSKINKFKKELNMLIKAELTENGSCSLSVDYSTPDIILAEALKKAGIISDGRLPSPLGKYTMQIEPGVIKVLLPEEGTSKIIYQISK